MNERRCRRPSIDGRPSKKYIISDGFLPMLYFPSFFLLRLRRQSLSSQSKQTTGPSLCFVWRHRWEQSEEEEKITVNAKDKDLFCDRGRALIIDFFSLRVGKKQKGQKGESLATGICARKTSRWWLFYCANLWGLVTSWERNGAEGSRRLFFFCLLFPAEHICIWRGSLLPGPRLSL